jgi:hypothetical protein
MVTANVADWPAVTVCEVGKTDRTKSAADGALTLNALFSSSDLEEPLERELIVALSEYKPSSALLGIAQGLSVFSMTLTPPVGML